ncbi:MULTISPECIES: NUDIX domain-containing protein [unclassified Pseudomonas]|uniref:NUDIX domain-containing protein n=1 Tax=unclassified Pseudomonas TaxID=196821 RepID=UPI00249A3CF9|nr:NUDIX domain-containing protein [Pseudomonas sp. PS02290]
MRRAYSVHVFLTRSLGGERQYLIFQRAARNDLDLPAFFQGISGALEDQESFQDAAVREVFEETELRINSPIYSGFSHHYPIKEQWRKHYGAEPQQVEERVFTVDVSGMEDPVLSAEHTSFRWLRLTEALPLLTYGANAECLLSVDQLWSRAIGQAVPN